MSDGTAQTGRLSPERQLEKSANFKRVAERRANHALDQIRLLGVTADTSRYLYTERQTQLIVSTLRQAIDRLEATYTGRDALRVDL